jgi:putative endonuclease
MNNRGKLAELKSAIFLRDNGYELLDTNYISRFGEIDIIAKDKKYIIFVEVKMRESDSYVKPREYVDEFKQQKMAATANFYLSTHPTRLQPRFDVIEVICHNYEIKSIKHLENAFQLV